MPLKEISVSPMAPTKQPVLMEDVDVANHGKKQDSAEDAGEQPQTHSKSNYAFVMDPKDDPIPKKESDKQETNVTKVADLFVASSEKVGAEGGEPSHRPQSRSKRELLKRTSSILSTLTVISSNLDICRICHCEEDEESPLVTPCLCMGSLQHVHQACIQQWIKSSNTKSCELCRFQFVMQTKLKPIGKWEKLDMSTGERRKIICSVSFHIIAITCVVWALYVLIDHTTEDLRRNNGQTPWPFWTKLVVVAIGFTGGLVFMYVQCKVYLHLWLRLKAYNRVIYVQNCPADERLKARRAKTVPETPQPQIEIIN